MTTIEVTSTARITVNGVPYVAKPAVIDSTSLGIEDHGIMSSNITLKFDGSAFQGAGGYCFDTPVRDANGDFIGRRGTAFGCEFIRRTLEVAGVTEWEKLRGTRVHALYDTDRYGEFIKGIASFDLTRAMVFTALAEEMKL